MNIDEITLFRDAGPAVPPYSDHAKQSLRAALLTAAADPAPRPARHRSGVGRRRIIAVAGLTTALAVGVTVVQNVDFGGGHANTRVLGPVASAEELATRAIRQAATAPAWNVRADQWSYGRSTLAGSSRSPGGSLTVAPTERVTSEVWTSVNGRQTASVVNGKVVMRPAGGTGYFQKALSYQDVLALPTDHDALLAAVTALAVPSGDAFAAIENLMAQYVLPPKLRAAMYGVLAKIPGVRLDRDAMDAARRHGVALYRIEEGYLQDEIIINPTTFQYMGDCYVAVRDHVTHGTDGDTHVVKGQIVGWSAQVAAAIVNSPGAR